MKNYIVTLSLLISLPSFAAEHTTSLSSAKRALSFIDSHQTDKLIAMVDSGLVNPDELFTDVGLDAQRSLLAISLMVAVQSGQTATFKAFLTKADFSKPAIVSPQKSGDIETLARANCARCRDQDKAREGLAKEILALVVAEKNSRDFWDHPHNK